VSGYIGGKLDLIVQRVVDTWMCFPQLIIMMIMITILISLVTLLIIIKSWRVGLDVMMTNFSFN